MEGREAGAGADIGGLISPPPVSFCDSPEPDVHGGYNVPAEGRWPRVLLGGWNGLSGLLLCALTALWLVLGCSRPSLEAPRLLRLGC